MGQGVHPGRAALTALLAPLFFLSSCKLDESTLPTGPTGDDSVGGLGSLITGTLSADAITAPIIADPLPGSTVAETQPTLKVLNSARGQRAEGAPVDAQAQSIVATYLFQVSTSPEFTTLVAQSGQVPEGADGTTAWTIDLPLTDGTHFWRVRARTGATDSEFSATAQFHVGEESSAAPPPANNPAPPPAPTPAGTIISDPLRGSSIGDVAGGQFSSQGWTVTSPGNFIRYEVPTLEKGWVEFDTSGLREENPANSQFMLFGMWDPTAGPFRENPYRVNLQKLHPNPHNPPYLRVRWISGRQQHDEGNRFFAWNPNQVYHWRIQWGPAPGGGHLAEVILDGVPMIEINYSRAYRPNVHFIELGSAERGESIVGVTSSNFQVGS